MSLLLLFKETCLSSVYQNEVPALRVWQENLNQGKSRTQGGSGGFGAGVSLRRQLTGRKEVVKGCVGWRTGDWRVTKATEAEQGSDSCLGLQGIREKD